jgi:glycerate 2-kinase
MKKIVCIPDSFKGTLSSSTVCEVMKTAINQHLPHCDVITIPVADGGEGSVDAFLSAVGGEKVYCRVFNPYFEPMEAFYGRLMNILQLSKWQLLQDSRLFLIVSILV